MLPPNDEDEPLSWRPPQTWQEAEVDLGSLEPRIAGLEAKIQELEGTLGELAGNVQRLENRLENIAPSWKKG